MQWPPLTDQPQSCLHEAHSTLLDNVQVHNSTLPNGTCYNCPNNENQLQVRINKRVVDYLTKQNLLIALQTAIVEVFG